MCSISIVKLTLKPDAWRLFRYIPSDIL
ncbi:DUF4225 domain-containing protein [Pectobacterium brasiliense]